MCYNKYLKCLVFTILICFLNVVSAHSQNKDIPQELYKASGIPDSLKDDANSVVRYNLEEYNVLGPGKEIYTAHTIVTVLNEKGNHEAEISFPYNRKFSAVTAFEMRIYDATGNLIKKYHKSDLYEHVAEGYESLVTDDRVKEIRHTIANYPTTVEMTYEIDQNSLIGLGDWGIQGPEQSIQNSTCKVSIAANSGFRYLNKNTFIKPQVSDEHDKQVYAWTVSNLKAFKLEEGAMAWCVMPRIEFVQDKFEYYGLPGNISTWQTYGNWQQALNADVCNLSPQRVSEIKAMTDTIKTDKGKARFLYKYMQQNMRYVNIKLGVGGLKPFPAQFVDEKKYGDCKALSNYMHALLKAVNINSYYAKINAGENEEPATYSFPIDYSNHIILCVPFKNDTTWLECTSNTMPFGVLGSFTENRNALLITEDGGKLVNTPKSAAQENQFNSEAHIILDPEGGAKTQVKIFSTGEYRELYLAMSARKMDDQKEFLIRNLNIKQPSAFDFKSEKDENGAKEIDLSLEYDQFCDVKAGDKQFYRPSAFLLWSTSVPVLEKRKTNYYWDYPRIKTCSTTIDLPTGFEVETLPANASLKFTYGNYEINYVYNKDKNQVVSTAKFVLNNQVIPAAKYTEMQQYMDGIAKAQNKKLVIRKKA
ncbi:DUF3857 domain-containing protein [Mucilaginibacter sp. McL0603]|uniref:DUF3857 domain-containing protein n=1 Tax=Mucilaginibacter sp. McL0603 TaxID=3415670 RepID=UPI003CF2430E